MTKEEKDKTLNKLKEKMLRDDSLPLKEGTTNLVFGEGNPDARVLFIGEGPGYWEDQKGRPFVGNAGGFLNYLLSSVKIPREEVFITNVVHYRPPANRDPLPEEINAFKLYLDKMIEIIEPTIVVTLGRFSMAKFIPGVKISDVHGKSRKLEFGGREIIVVPMYHPAAALRRTEIKLKTIDDFKILPKLLDQINQGKTEKTKDAEQMQLV
jgi:DNA polymerase